MILREVRLKNFGIYGGDNHFDLYPLPSGNFHRPVVLLRGKNGVGKTTFVEAMRLCLHGNLGVSNRMSQMEYDMYLRGRVHHPRQGDTPLEAAVELIFDYVNLGKRQRYHVQRSWQLTEHRVEKQVALWEDDRLLEQWDADQCDQFLRELIPPGILDLFFFDGERIQTLAEDNEAGNLLLGETIRALLGLDMVDQLSRDLDIYVARQQSHGEVAQLQKDLTSATNEQESIIQEQATLVERQQALKVALAHLHEQIAICEQQLASEGGQFAAKRESLQAQAEQLQRDLDAQQRGIHDLCSSLMPFAIIPKLLKAVAKRLELEREHERTQTAQQVLTEKLDALQAKITSDDYWVLIGIYPEPLTRHLIFQKLAENLHDLIAGPALLPKDIILRVSEEERATLLRWIDQALHDVPSTFMQATARLRRLEKLLADVQEALLRAPKQEALQPLMAQLGQLHQQLGSQQREQEAVSERLRHLQWRLDQMTSQQQRIREQIKAREADTSRLYLATKTQALLDDYKVRLARHKIAHVEELLVRHFNRLCRKETFLDKVTIDPERFHVILYRLGHPFSRRQLSAGESQLFAIATLWALREVSGRPAPVVIDTPLSRLDSEHRLSIVQEFFPHTSHQLIVLATDAEIDEAHYRLLQPAISHIYELNFDAAVNAITYQRNENLTLPLSLIRLEGVAAP